MEQIQKEVDFEQLNIQVMNSRPMSTPRKDDRMGENNQGGSDRKQIDDATTNMTEDEVRTAELYKNVRVLLNKLTPKTLEKLLNQIRALSIDNEDRLQGVIDLVYKKAVDEPNISTACAVMCKELALMQVPANTTKSNKHDQQFVNFRKLLITRCQKEFETNSVYENARNLKLKEIDACTDPEKKKELQALLEEKDRRMCVKAVGNIRFIGELFKQQMLTVKIMLRCIHILLDNKDEYSLECLCALLTTVGKNLELAKNQNLQSYFNTMQEIVDEKHGKFSSRVRFMLQDVIDLRNSKWLPRRQDLNPKTMEQIQKEANIEQLNIQVHVTRCDIDLRNSSRVLKRLDLNPKTMEQIQKEVDFEQLNIQVMNSRPMSTPRKDDRMGENNQGGSDRKQIDDATTNMTEDEVRTAELYKNVRVLLNKLTPKTFELLNQIRALSIDNEDRLQGVIDLVYKKAVDEPNISTACAVMCKELAPMQVPANSTKSNKQDQQFVNFRKLLITRCQKEFETNSVYENARNLKLKEIDACTDPEKKMELQVLLEKEDRRMCVKAVGNIRFIGELFKQQMLTIKIMLRCIHILLDNKDEDSLECLCVLLTTIGKDLELGKNQNLQSCFNTMQEIVDEKHGKISGRVRSMLQDVIDLRNSKWVPKRQDLNPKTMEQIQNETDTEQLEITKTAATAREETTKPMTVAGRWLGRAIELIHILLSLPKL